MTGVEILSSATIYETEVYWWFIPLFASIGLVIGLCISIKEWIDCGFDVEYILWTLSLTFAFGFVGCLGVVMSEHETDTVDYIEYKVTIDDSVSMNEFLDKYEILDQEGKIYTVKEK